MRNLLLLCVAMLLSFSLLSMPQKKEGVSDPEATEILKKVRSKYEKYTTIQTDFKLTIKMGDEVEIQKGRLFQKSDKYRVEMDEYNMIYNGETRWFHLKKDKEVQISNPDPDEADEFMSPSSLMRIYEKNKFVYKLQGEIKEGATTIQEIEFKPKDRDSEFAKYRLSVDKATNRIIKIKAFSKNGVHYTLEMQNFKPNRALSEKHFLFDKTKPENKDVEIIDLR